MICCVSFEIYFVAKFARVEHFCYHDKITLMPRFLRQRQRGAATRNMRRLKASSNKLSWVELTTKPSPLLAIVVS